MAPQERAGSAGPFHQPGSGISILAVGRLTIHW
jgi:hypothetical protein